MDDGVARRGIAGRFSYMFPKSGFWRIIRWGLFREALTEHGGAAALLIRDDTNKHRISVLLRPMAPDLHAPGAAIEKDDVNDHAWIGSRESTFSLAGMLKRCATGFARSASQRASALRRAVGFSAMAFPDTANGAGQRIVRSLVPRAETLRRAGDRV
jgi:hypothetical protein